MAEERAQRRLAAILAADVVGYSRLMEADEESTVRALKSHREVVDRLIGRHEGRIFSTAGDSVVAEFGSAVEAVRAAISIQEELKARNAELPGENQMMLRIGVNLGDIIVEGDNLYGDGVNVAARIEGLCAPGEIFVSDMVQRQIEGKLSVASEDMGEHSVKNISKPVRVYRVRAGAERKEDRDTPRDAPPPSDKPSIAVLPFENMSGDPEQEYFSDGIAEDLITDLAKISGLFVVARNAAFLYKGKAVKPLEVSRELGVRYVLEGSVRKAGDRVRITAQLIDPATGYHLWAERYDRDLTDIFALQDEITEKIVAALEVKLSAREQERVASRYTDNPEAYDYFLRGRAYQSRNTKETNAQARAQFERAVKLDPNFAAAYAVLSHTHWRDWHHQWDDDPRRLDQAHQTAKKAIGLDDSLPLAHSLLAWVYVFNKQFEEAIAEAKRAISLDPNFVEGYARLGNILSFAGNPKAGADSIKKAMRLNPHYPPGYLTYLGHAYYVMGKHVEAIDCFKRALTGNPDLFTSTLFLAASLSALGRREEARAQLAETMRISPGVSLKEQAERWPFKDQSVIQRFLEDLRQAGLPE